MSANFQSKAQALIDALKEDMDRELLAEVTMLRALLAQTYVVVRENAVAHTVTGQWDRLQEHMLQVYNVSIKNGTLS